jgi:hydroxymethylpyrimidine/phosphomethylpyrimidine kinase
MAIPVARHGVAATHGAGCTHSAALAAGLGAGLPLDEAARQAAVIAGQAVEHGLPWLGAGEGPVHVLHEYRAITASATRERPRDERQLQR